jgi:hypothetical protein
MDPKTARVLEINAIFGVSRFASIYWTPFLRFPFSSFRPHSFAPCSPLPALLLVLFLLYALCPLRFYKTPSMAMARIGQASQPFTREGSPMKKNLSAYYENKTYFHATWCLHVGMRVFYETIIFEILQIEVQDCPV